MSAFSNVFTVCFSADGTLLQIEDMQPYSDTSHVSQQLATDALELPLA